jgi:8-oxo-dGTP diphosphatase
MIKVAAAVITDHQGQILICQRGSGGSCEYLWEFPGGKKENGESLEECLIRECQEELEISIKVLRLLTQNSYAYPDKTIHFFFFKATIIHGQLKTNVHRQALWVNRSELNNFEFCPADKPVVELVKQGLL